MERETLPKLMTARELAGRLGLARWRIYDLTRSGILPAVRIGRSYRYSTEAIREWIERGGTKQEEGK